MVNGRNAWVIAFRRPGGFGRRFPAAARILIPASRPNSAKARHLRVSAHIFAKMALGGSVQME